MVVQGLSVVELKASVAIERAQRGAVVMVSRKVRLDGVSFSRSARCQLLEEQLWRGRSNPLVRSLLSLVRHLWLESRAASARWEAVVVVPV
jgi:hypothetical protein